MYRYALYIFIFLLNFNLSSTIPAYILNNQPTNNLVTPEILVEESAKINVPTPVKVDHGYPTEKSAANETPQISEKSIKPKQTKKSIEKRLKRYFERHKIKPSMVINNEYNGARDERVEIIKVSNHKITWFHSYKEPKIKINDDLFTLEEKVSLNNADDSRKIEGKIVNNWIQIKLFKVNGRELIGIEMGNDPCTGLMCSVTFFLIYDLKTKSKNFFGDFRINNELKLYDFRNNGMIDFLGTTNVGFTYTAGFEFKHIYELYTLDKKGNFQRQLHINQKPFYFKRTFKTLEVRYKDDEDYKELEKKFEQNWMEEIK